MRIYPLPTFGSGFNAVTEIVTRLQWIVPDCDLISELMLATATAGTIVFGAPDTNRTCDPPLRRGMLMLIGNGFQACIVTPLGHLYGYL